MKSLVEEASSITKAIEKAWIRAGQPQSFSVKIFEIPEVGFLGFVKKSAKVGIFFEEPLPEKTKRHYSRPANKRAPRNPSEYKPRTNTPHREPREDTRESRPTTPRREPREDTRKSRPTTPRREPREDTRESRPTTPRREPREDTRESRPAERPRNDRPQRDSRDSEQPETRQPRSPRPERPAPERPARDRKPASNPAPKTITPVSKPQEAVAPKAIKRPLKISGRCFSGHKKDKSEGS